MNPEFAKLVAQILEVVQKDIDHQLLPKYRLNLYNNLQFLPKSKIHQFLGWLGFLTAKKVLPAWDESFPDNSSDKFNRMPVQILALTENILLGKVLSEDVSEEVADYHESTGTMLLGREDKIPLAAKFALVAALEALTIGWGRRPFQPFSRTQIEGGITDDRITSSSGDVASSAVLSWSVLGRDNNKITYDKFKRLEFWEWWLTEAIPQAWELASESA